MNSINLNLPQENICGRFFSFLFKSNEGKKGFMSNIYNIVDYKKI